MPLPSEAAPDKAEVSRDHEQQRIDRREPVPAQAGEQDAGFIVTELLDHRVGKPCHTVVPRQELFLPPAPLPDHPSGMVGMRRPGHGERRTTPTTTGRCPDAWKEARLLGEEGRKRTRRYETKACPRSGQPRSPTPKPRNPSQASRSQDRNTVDHRPTSPEDGEINRERHEHLRRKSLRSAWSRSASSSAETVASPLGRGARPGPRRAPFHAERRRGARPISPAGPATPGDDSEGQAGHRHRRCSGKQTSERLGTGDLTDERERDDDRPPGQTSQGQ